MNPVAMAVIIVRPVISPIRGDSTMKMSVNVQPLGMIAAKPALATAAPA